jgi:hypothetical protein
MRYNILASISEVEIRVAIFIGVPDVAKGGWAVVINNRVHE